MIQNKLTERNKTSASPEKIEELKKLINNKNYMDSSIESIAHKLSNSTEFKDCEIDRTSSCIGINCECCDKKRKCGGLLNNIVLYKIKESDFVDLLSEIRRRKNGRIIFRNISN